MAWVREKNPKPKASAPQRDPKEALEGLLSYLACKPAPGTNVQRYLRETSPHKCEKPEIVQRKPTGYNDEEGQDEDDYDIVSVRKQRSRPHQHHHSSGSLHQHRISPESSHHHHISQGSSPAPRRTPAPRYVSNVETRPYRPKTSVQTRRVVSSWSNATTPLAI